MIHKELNLASRRNKIIKLVIEINYFFKLREFYFIENLLITMNFFFIQVLSLVNCGDLLYECDDGTIINLTPGTDLNYIIDIVTIIITI